MLCINKSNPDKSQSAGFAKPAINYGNTNTQTQTQWWWWLKHICIPSRKFVKVALLFGSIFHTFQVLCKKIWLRGKSAPRERYCCGFTLRCSQWAADLHLAPKHKTHLKAMVLLWGTHSVLTSSEEIFLLSTGPGSKHSFALPNICNPTNCTICAQCAQKP